MTIEEKPEPSDLTEQIRNALRWGPVNTHAAVAAGFCCEYCGLDMLKTLEAYYSWQIDQIMPGGGYAPENCALACRTCNHLKHARPPNGSTREERLADARVDIERKMVKRQAELDQLRQIVGYAVAARA